MTDEATRIRGWRRWAPFLPLSVLIAFGLTNLRNVITEKTIPWHTGGFGMHASIEDSPYRFVRVYGVDESGTRERLPLPRPLELVTAITIHPKRENVREALSRVEIDDEQRQKFASLEVELWEYTFQSDPPRLSARFVLKHEYPNNE